MILDKLTNFNKYISLNSKFLEVANYLKSNDLLAFQNGEYKISGDDIKLIIAEAKSDINAQVNAEAHRKYIDIQIALNGAFEIGWSPLSECKSVLSEYNSEKDVMFFSDKADLIIPMKQGLFSILFPEDVHSIFPPNDFVKKAIFKVAVD